MVGTIRFSTRSHFLIFSRPILRPANKNIPAISCDNIRQLNNNMLHFRQFLLARFKLHPRLFHPAPFESSCIQDSMSVRRVHHLQLPSITAAANSLGVRCVSAPQLVPIQVPT
jgi:hypothetical protein